MKKIVTLGLPLFFVCSTILANEYHFGVKVIGKGRPMILIPGLNSPGELWNTTVDYYKSHYTCYVISLAGFGGQPPSGRKDSLIYLQRDEILQYIKEQKLHKPILVGFSFGANVALWLACTDPQVFGPIINLDGLAFDDAFFNPAINIDSIKQIAIKRYSNYVEKTPDYWQNYYTRRNSSEGIKMANEYLKDLVNDTAKIPLIMEWDKQTDLRSSTLMQLEMDTLDLRPLLKNITQPMLTLAETNSFREGHSTDVMLQCFRQEFVNAPNNTLVFSEKSRHFIMWDDPQWMFQQIDQFLAKAK